MALPSGCVAYTKKTADPQTGLGCFGNPPPGPHLICGGCGEGTGDSTNYHCCYGSMCPCPSGNLYLGTQFWYYWRHCLGDELTGNVFIECVPPAEKCGFGDCRPGREGCKPKLDTDYPAKYAQSMGNALADLQSCSTFTPVEYVSDGGGDKWLVDEAGVIPEVTGRASGFTTSNLGVFWVPPGIGTCPSPGIFVNGLGRFNIAGKAGRGGNWVAYFCHGGFNNPCFWYFYAHGNTHSLIKVAMIVIPKAGLTIRDFGVERIRQWYTYSFNDPPAPYQFGNYLFEQNFSNGRSPWSPFCPGNGSAIDRSYTLQGVDLCFFEMSRSAYETPTGAIDQQKVFDAVLGAPAIGMTAAPADNSLQSWEWPQPWLDFEATSDNHWICVALRPHPLFVPQPFAVTTPGSGLYMQWQVPESPGVASYDTRWTEWFDADGDFICGPSVGTYTF